MNYPIFSKNDLNGFWALFADTLANLLIISGVCRFVFNMPNDIVFGRILPGAAISIILGIVVYVYLGAEAGAQRKPHGCYGAALWHQYAGDVRLFVRCDRPYLLEHQ